MQTPAFKAEEKIIIAKNFQNPSIKVTFMPPENYKKKEMDDEENKGAEKDQQEIQMERKNIIESVIVRIMKGRKIENH